MSDVGLTRSGEEALILIKRVCATAPNLRGGQCPQRTRQEICQKIHTTGFLGPKFYTVKVHKLQLFLLTKKQRKCINISNLSDFLVRIPLSV